MAAAEAEKEQLPEQELAESLMDLSNIRRTVDGTGFAYQSLVCAGKRIGGIKAIEAYTGLQHIDLSQNAVKDVSAFKGLPYILRLNLSSNEITHIRPWEEGMLQHLVHLDLSGNSLSALLPLQLPALQTANFARNQITTCQEFPGHERLVDLDLSENHLTTMAGIANLPALTKLNVSSNELVDINAISGMPLLETFNLAKNQLVELEGPWQELEALRSLDLSENGLTSTKPLEILRQLSKLRSLMVAGNPFRSAAAMEPACPEADETLDVEAEAAHEPPPYLRLRVLVAHWRLTSIDGADVTPEEWEEAKQLNVQLLLEERERQRVEAEAAAAAEGGAE